MNMTKLALRGRRGTQYIGPVVDDGVPGVQVRCRKILSEAWHAAHPTGEAEEPPTDADWVIQVVILGSVEYPSRLQHAANWKRGHFQVVELSVTPWPDWKAAADRDIASRDPKNAGASSVVLTGDLDGFDEKRDLTKSGDNPGPLYRPPGPSGRYRVDPDADFLRQSPVATPAPKGRRK